MATVFSKGMRIGAKAASKGTFEPQYAFPNAF